MERGLGPGVSLGEEVRFFFLLLFLFFWCLEAEELLQLCAFLFYFLPEAFFHSAVDEAGVNGACSATTDNSMITYVLFFV